MRLVPAISTAILRGILGLPLLRQVKMNPSLPAGRQPGSLATGKQIRQALTHVCDGCKPNLIDELRLPAWVRSNNLHSNPWYVQGIANAATSKFRDQRTNKSVLSVTHARRRRYPFRAMSWASRITSSTRSPHKKFLCRLIFNY